MDIEGLLQRLSSLWLSEEEVAMVQDSDAFEGMHVVAEN